MDFDDGCSGDAGKPAVFPVTPPFIWPDARLHNGQAHYAEQPPAKSLFTDADLISGVLVGAADKTVEWFADLLASEQKRRVCVVVVLFPAGPTRARHLQAIHQIQGVFQTEGRCLEVRLLPISRLFAGDCERAVFPPTIVQAHHTGSGVTVTSIGSVGDLGHDPAVTGSFNLVFRPDDAQRDAWRRWFQHIFDRGTPLSEETVQVPHLVPAEGDPKAARQWEEFEKACRPARPESDSWQVLDPETGEVKNDAASREVAWDEGKTALDPLAQVLQQVYANGWLVTVDEASRIKPLTIPVKATLLGQRSERSVGSVKQRQSFTLQVLDDHVEKAIENCRKVTDVMDLLTLPLSQGNRWLPVSAKDLLEQEIEARNSRGRELLVEALGGEDVKAFISKRLKNTRADLNEMYRQLGQGDAVPDDKLRLVLDEIERRLDTALGARITPRALFNRIGPPNLTSNAPDENWSQPLALLSRSASILRRSLTDRFFPNRLAGVPFSGDDIRQYCNPFDDAIVSTPEMGRARTELDKIEEIVGSIASARVRCQQIWRLIRGESLEPKT